MVKERYQAHIHYSMWLFLMQYPKLHPFTSPHFCFCTYGQIQISKNLRNIYIYIHTYFCLQEELHGSTLSLKPPISNHVPKPFRGIMYVSFIKEAMRVAVNRYMVDIGHAEGTHQSCTGTNKQTTAYCKPYSGVRKVVHWYDDPLS